MPFTAGRVLSTPALPIDGIVPRCPRSRSSHPRTARRARPARTPPTAPRRPRARCDRVIPPHHRATATARPAYRATEATTLVDSSDDAPSTSAGVTDVRVRTLRDERDIPRVATLCSAVFKETAVPLPKDLADDDVMRDVAAFFETRYESAMIRDLTGITTRNLREKRRCENQTRAEYGRTRARATARELAALQRTRTSVDQLTTAQLREMRARITDEVELELDRERKVPNADYLRRVRSRQWMQLIADAIVPGGRHRVGVHAERARTPAPGAGEIVSATRQVCVPDAPAAAVSHACRTGRTSRTWRVLEARRVGGRAIIAEADGYRGRGPHRDVAARQYR